MQVYPVLREVHKFENSFQVRKRARGRGGREIQRHIGCYDVLKVLLDDIISQKYRCYIVLKLYDGWAGVLA